MKVVHAHKVCLPPINLIGKSLAGCVGNDTNQSLDVLGQDTFEIGLPIYRCSEGSSLPTTGGAELIEHWVLYVRQRLTGTVLTSPSSLQKFVGKLKVPR